MSPFARPAAALVAGVLAVTLSACGSGFDANTYDERNLDDAANADVGRIALRNVYLEAPDEGIVHPAGSNAMLKLAVVNTGEQSDRLVEVSTKAAASAKLVLGGREVSSLEVAAGSPSDPELEVALTGLTRDLRSGEFLEVTVRFERNGSQTFQVPVGSPSAPVEREHSKNVHPDEKG